MQEVKIIQNFKTYSGVKYLESCSNEDLLIELAKRFPLDNFLHINNLQGYKGTRIVATPSIVVYY